MVASILGEALVAKALAKVRMCKKIGWTPSKASKNAKGGTYKLRDPETGQVRRTGKTNDLNRRQGEHRRGNDTKDLEFEVDRRSDNEVARRGREQIIHDQHPEADLNKRNPISPNNPRRDEYLDAGRKL